MYIVRLNEQVIHFKVVIQNKELKQLYFLRFQDGKIQNAKKSLDWSCIHESLEGF